MGRCMGLVYGCFHYADGSDKDLVNLELHEKFSANGHYGQSSACGISVPTMSQGWNPMC